MTYSHGDEIDDAFMFFTAEQLRRAALVPPTHVALASTIPAMQLIEASNSPSLTNCPISAEDIANARVIYGQYKDCAEG